jgi:hypothetical protein
VHAGLDAIPGGRQAMDHFVTSLGIQGAREATASAARRRDRRPRSWPPTCPPLAQLLERCGERPGRDSAQR